MADPIPLEDNFNDVIGKAQRGLKLADEDLAGRAGISVEQLQQIKSGQFDEGLVRAVAPVLNLGANTLVELGQKAWYPEAFELHGLAQFNSQYEDMTVNSYLVYELFTKVAVAFDTGANAGAMLAFAQKYLLRIKLILLTHAHTDHIMELPRLKKITLNCPAYSSAYEPVEGTETFEPGRKFEVGNFWIEARQTSGHAVGGTTFTVGGLKRPVAIVGDAIFCCSMGGGMVDYDEALRTNRENIFSLRDDTILCPGHGPMTSLAEQKQHNPFYPEFQQ